MKARQLLLACGVAAALVYTLTDLVAAVLYPDYNILDQAVSELFAIGAPTSGFVVPLFSISSLLLIAFAIGVWLSAGRRRAVQAMAIMFALSGLTALVLWNVFPMHMRGAARTLTDQMHLILSANPFVLLSLVASVVAFRGLLRTYSIATVVVVLAPAAFAFQLAPALDAQQPTPWLGLAERIAQYGYGLWQAFLALTLLGNRPAQS